MKYIILLTACIPILFNLIAFPLWAGTPLELKVAEKALELDSIELAINNRQTGRLQHVRIRWGKGFDVSLDDAHMPRNLLDEVRKYTRGRVLSPVHLDLNQSKDGDQTFREVEVTFFMTEPVSSRISLQDEKLNDRESTGNIICRQIKKVTIYVNIDWRTFYASIQCGAEIIFIRCPESGPCH